MKRRIIIGPGTPSVLLAAVIVTISILVLLCASAVRQDEKLSDRAVLFRQAEYTSMAQAQRHLAQLDALLAASAAESANQADYVCRIAENMLPAMTFSDGVVCWTEEQTAGRNLMCEVRVLPLGDEKRYAWQKHAFAAAETDEEMDWDAVSVVGVDADSDSEWLFEEE